SAVMSAQCVERGLDSLLIMLGMINFHRVLFNLMFFLLTSAAGKFSIHDMIGSWNISLGNE
ncbi:MAG: hypothetical protein DRP70_13845, partial [Spirochaetes bacterium]